MPTETEDAGPLTSAALAATIIQKSKPARQFLDVLPSHKSGRQAIEWLPNSGDTYSTLLGYVILTGGRDRTSYAVSEFPVGWDGRGFLFSKVSGKGTDPTQDRYCVFVGKTPPGGTSCECRGHQRFSHCRHSDAAQTLLANHWI